MTPCSLFRCFSVCLVSFAFLTLGAPSATAAPPDARPRVFLLPAARLAQIRATATSNAQSQRIVAVARAEADRLLPEGPFSVTQKTLTPPSGDKHDYMSQAPYFWPDPAKPNGLPYIRRDGEHNPEIRKISDHEQFGRMGHDARLLALAYFLTGQDAYADRAALLLRTWFLSPATRMNPNLEFAQGIPGINTGRGIGIIESRALIDVTDAAGLLAGSPAWSAADQQGLRAWLTEYLHWMRTSKNGLAEDSSKNNHGNWYDVQVADLALFLDDRSLAAEIVERAKLKRIAVQIEPDGRQPLELARTNAWGYSNFSLEALGQLATLGQQAGVDLWNYRTADGRSIRAALEFLLPYASGAKPWDYRQIGGFHASAIEHLLLRAAEAYHDPSLRQLAEKISERDDLESLLLE